MENSDCPSWVCWEQVISTLFSVYRHGDYICLRLFCSSPRFVRYKIGFIRLGWSRSMYSVSLNGLGWPVAFQMGMETASFSSKHSDGRIGWGLSPLPHIR